MKRKKENKYIQHLNHYKIKINSDRKVRIAAEQTKDLLSWDFYTINLNIPLPESELSAELKRLGKDRFISFYCKEK